jgi:quercetin dioxygenase-like cupin family protein
MSTTEKQAAVTNAPFITKAPGREVRFKLGHGPEKSLHVLAEGSRTNRRCTVAVHEIAAGEQAPFHEHTLEDEGFYVLEGEITFLMPEDEVDIEAGPGEFVWHPNNRAHGFRAGDKPVKVIQFLLPGTELVPAFFEAAGEAELETPEQLAALAEMSWRDYGTKILGPEAPPSTRAEVTRGPVTPDARMLMPSEVDRMVNAPFKSDPSHKLTLNVDNGVMTDVELILHAWGHQTGDIIEVLEVAWSKLDMVYPHVHTLEEEGFYVLEGEFTVYVAGHEGIVKAVGHPGDFIWAPRDLPHYYHITGAEGARVLTILVPGGGGFLDFFSGIALQGIGADLSTEEKFMEFKDWGERNGQHVLAEGEWPGDLPS